MNCVKFWFHASFYELLPSERKSGEFTYCFKGEPSLKHLVEALRIPHTEVGKIIVNEQEAGLTYLVQNGDAIAVFPIIGQRPYFLDEGGGLGIDEPRFILDNHLGKLAVYLRMLGFDALYSNQIQDDELAYSSTKEGRILLTRDRGLLMRTTIKFGYYIRSMDTHEQLAEVLKEYRLINRVHPFKRCLRCNGLLVTVDKNHIMDRLEPLTQKYFNEFSICHKCEKIYWKGSHYERMRKFIINLRDNNQRSIDNE